MTWSWTFKLWDGTRVLGEKDASWRARAEGVMDLLTTKRIAVLMGDSPPSARSQPAAAKRSGRLIAERL